MKLSLSVLLAALAPGALFAQDPGQPRSEDAPQVRRLTEIERLFHAYGISHGGRQELRDLETLSFRVIPIQVSTEGEQELEPIRVDAQLNGIDRLMRLEEEIDGRAVVKFADGMVDVTTFVNGEAREIPELIQGAREEAKMFYVLLDLLYKPESPDFQARFDRRDVKRDGKLFFTADFEFHPSRELPHTYRLFYDAEDGFVRRIDVHDTRTAGNLRVFTMYLSGYAPAPADEERARRDAEEATERAQAKLDAAETPEERASAEEELERAQQPPRTPMFPARVEFVSREGEPWIIWRMVDFVANADFEPGHFSEP